jgi:hypothetical protein
LRFGGNAATKPSERIYKPIAIGFRALPVRDVGKCFHDVDVETFGSKGDKDLQYKVDFDVLNEYIENNRHILQRKPKAQHIAIEAPKVEAPDLQKIVKNMFAEVTANHKAVVFPSVFAKAWDELPPTKVKKSHYEKYLEFIANREAYNLISSKTLIGDHKVKREHLPEVVVQKAALMMAYLEGATNDN